MSKVLWFRHRIRWAARVAARSGEGFTDGSVRWPRWSCLASGGMSLVKLDGNGQLVRWHAATLAQVCRHVAVHTEMLGIAAAAVYALLEVFW